jgi:hypothetical protein
MFHTFFIIVFSTLDSVCIRKMFTKKKQKTVPVKPCFQKLNLRYLQYYILYGIEL